MTQEQEKNTEPQAEAEKTPQPSKPEAKPSDPTFDLKAMLQQKKAPESLDATPPPQGKPAEKSTADASGLQGALKDQIAQLKAELESHKKEAAKTREELEITRASVMTDKQHRRLNMLRNSGVDEATLNDSELLKLAPTFDPDTTEGKAQMIDWLQSHQRLIDKKHRSTPSKMPSILEKGSQSETVLGVFGGKESLVKKIAQIVEGG